MAVESVATKVSSYDLVNVVVRVQNEEEIVMSSYPGINKDQSG
jgi:hypothetical protein